MRGKIVLAGLILSLSGIATSAQTAPGAPTKADLYCAGYDHERVHTARWLCDYRRRLELQDHF